MQRGRETTRLTNQVERKHSCCSSIRCRFKAAARLKMSLNFEVFFFFSCCPGERGDLVSVWYSESAATFVLFQMPRGSEAFSGCSTIGQERRGHSWLYSSQRNVMLVCRNVVVLVVLFCFQSCRSPERSLIRKNLQEEWTCDWRRVMVGTFHTFLLISHQSRGFGFRVPPTPVLRWNLKEDSHFCWQESALWHGLQPVAGRSCGVVYKKKETMNLQQPPALIPPVHPDVQMKPLPFYDVLDVLIKPSSLGMSSFPSCARAPV